MQKYFLLLLVILILPSCNSTYKTKDNSDKRVLTVTIEPQRYFLNQIVGDTYRINTLVPPGASPESYEPAPSVMLNMADSKIYFKVGDLGFERAWSERLAVNNPEVLIIDCSEGIELIEGHDHHHSEGDDTHAHIHESLDPHIWSSPRAVKLLVKNMLEAMILVDPDNEEIFRANFDKFIDKVDSTDLIISNMLDNLRQRSFIIFHPSLGYFANDYDLHQYSIEFEGKNPSPAQIIAIVDAAKENNINTLFIQKGFDTKNGEVIASEVGAEIFEIDPLSYNWDGELIRIASILSREN